MPSSFIIEFLVIGIVTQYNFYHLMDCAQGVFLICCHSLLKSGVVGRFAGVVGHFAAVIARLAGVIDRLAGIFDRLAGVIGRFECIMAI